MANDKNNKNEELKDEETIIEPEVEEEQEETPQEEILEEDNHEEVSDENDQEEVPELTPEQRCEQLEADIEKEKKEYLFLMADFDNYRKRTLQEKQELIKNGGQKVLEGILPVVDDIERAIDAIAQGGDLDSLKEGVDLIHSKLLAFLKSNNVEPIESTGELFDTDFHEAVTTFPAPEEDQKGKVIDTVLKGYKLNDKVLRHAKVVVGQ
ncbi:MAG: nucleotide exchange factor GrpE [Muribaculaceae bacterium]|nr:nucleotide exchange factor GrpE [Muribaculaceae bacterium]MBR5117294.1 nucleotide exchange factor GrpE [Muribaculaceae bacterium]